MFIFVGIGPASAATPVIGGYFQPGGYYGGISGHHYWINYCPICHHYNCLSNNPKGTNEGELTCYKCDADYDGCTGADKCGSGARAWLRAPSQLQFDEWYHPEKLKQNQTITQPVVIDPIIDVEGIKIKQSTYQFIQTKISGVGI